MTYDGPATVAADAGEDIDRDIDADIDVQVQLRGHFEPIDGRFHWYGRIQSSDTLAQAHRSGATVTVRTPHGKAVGRLSDIDPWGRFRIAGTGTPPFPA